MKIITLTLGELAVNTYIVFRESEKECALIDPGDGLEAIEKELERYSLTPTAILLTHSHFDHIASLNLLKKKYGCPVYVHKSDVEMLADSMKNLSSYFCDEPIEMPSPEYQLSDNDSFEAAGLCFDVIHTPGHSKGSVVYKCESTLFTGDTLFCGCCGRWDLWGGDALTLRKSLDRLFTLDDTLDVLSGHGEATTIGEQRSHYKYFV